jgi:hypothetical protein
LQKNHDSDRLVFVICALERCPTRGLCIFVGQIAARLVRSETTALKWRFPHENDALRHVKDSAGTGEMP